MGKLLKKRKQAIPENQLDFNSNEEDEHGQETESYSDEDDEEENHQYYALQATSTE